MELNPCPKCHSSKKRTFPVQCYFEIRYSVRCSVCGFETDSFETKQEAREVWNSLSRNEKNCSYCAHDGMQWQETGPCVGCTIKKDPSEPNGKRPSMWTRRVGEGKK